MPSNEFVRQLQDGGGDPILTLLRVNVDGTLFYYVNNTESVTSNVSGTSEFYQRGMFKINLPEDTAEGLPSAAISFMASDRQIIRGLREADNKIIVDLWLVLASNPNTVEYGPVNYQSSSFAVSEKDVNLSLDAEPILDIRLPSTRFTPNTAPGLWKSQ